jgi:threonine aldolase
VLAEAVADTPGLRLDPPEVETNLVWFEVDPDLAPAPRVAAALKERGVLVHPAGPTTLRACTHLDVSAADVEFAADALRQVGRTSAAPAR